MRKYLIKLIIEALSQYEETRAAETEQFLDSLQGAGGDHVKTILKLRVAPRGQHQRRFK